MDDSGLVTSENQPYIQKDWLTLFINFSRENTYVRIVGHLKSFKENSRSLIAFYLTPVTDFNEITYHMLDVIHSHLALSKVQINQFNS